MTFAPASMHCLPARLDMQAVVTLWQDHIHRHAECLDAAAVDYISGSGMQCLLAMAAECAAQARPFRLMHASAALREAFADYGLTAFLSAWEQ